MVKKVTLKKLHSLFLNTGQNYTGQNSTSTNLKESSGKEIPYKNWKISAKVQVINIAKYPTPASLISFRQVKKY